MLTELSLGFQPVSAIFNDRDTIYLEFCVAFLRKLSLHVLFRGKDSKSLV